jgi:hypothetical protein
MKTYEYKTNDSRGNIVTKKINEEELEAKGGKDKFFGGSNLVITWRETTSLPKLTEKQEWELRELSNLD